MRQLGFVISWVILLLLAQVCIGHGKDVAKPSELSQSVQPEQQQILFLNTYPIGLPIPDSIDRGVLSAIREGGGSISDIFVEHLDFSRKPGVQYRLMVADLLRRKLAGKHIGVIIAEGTPALNFLATEAKDLFPDAALLTLITPDIGSALDRSSRVIDIPWQVDPAGTLRLAIDLFPKTERVVVVTGANDKILPFLEQAKEAFLPWRNSLDFEYTNEMTYEEMMHRVSSLPQYTIVLYSPYFSDTTGRSFVPDEVVRKISQSANAPVFATLESYLGYGIIGGALLRTEAIGQQAGRIALDYLHGHLELDKPVTTFNTPMFKMFDWNELSRWKANTRALPKDGIILNRQLTLYGQYKGTFIAVGVAFLGLSALTLLLWAFNRRLKRLMVIANDSEARFRVMMEHAPEAILVYDFEHRTIADANPKATILFGCSMETLLQEDLMRFYQPDKESDGNESIDEYHAQAMTGNEVIFECPIRTFDRRKTQCEIRLVQLPLRGQRLLRASFIDITERKVAEEALRRSEAHLRTLVQTIPDLIWLKDKDGVFLSCNRMFERFYGAREAEIIGKTDYDFIDRELADFFRLHDRKAMAAGKPSSNEEWAIFADDGRRVLLETIKTPMYDSHGVFIGILGIGRDITERKHAEEERAKLEGQLQQAHRLEAIGQLAGGVAHDFNNMLAVIIGYTELVMEQVDRNQSIYNELEEIRTAAIRSADITRQLLAFARKQTVDPEVIDLNATLESLLKMLKRLIGEDVDLSWRPGKDLWTIKMDPSQLDQILANLCINARGAISGVGKIIVETENASFDDAYCSIHADFVPGEYIRLTVSDNGCGMSKEIMSRIFEPFFTTKAAGEGTGLGLATVYGAVKQNKGFINVYSEPGQGTTFAIYLPRYLGEAQQGQPKVARDTACGGTETILLVEDQANLLAMTQLMLQQLGYKVLAAPGPMEAIQMAKEFSKPIDLLITDVIMPEMNGRDLVERLLAVNSELKYLFMSGYTADIISPRGHLDDKVCFIQKPFSKMALDTKVRKTLRREKDRSMA